MLRKTTAGVLTLATALAGTGETSADYVRSGPTWQACVTSDPESGATQIDAACLLESLVTHYRALSAYEDEASVTHVTRRDGRSPQRVLTRIGCEIEDGRLRVQTPSSQVRRWFGLEGRYPTSPVLEDAGLAYDMWLAPHMTLKYGRWAGLDVASPEDEDDAPDARVRPAPVSETMTAAAARQVTIDDRPMLHLELRSADPEGSGAPPSATLDLYVNPESMLVERVVTQQRLPDGANFEATVEIRTKLAESAGRSVIPGGE